MSTHLRNLSAVLICIASFASSAQTKTSIEKFPYSFSNFVWWSDAELRSELHRKIPGLPDQIARSSAAESQIREALTALLRIKGVRADVQSIEPQANISSLQRAESAPPPSIVYSVLEPPQILVGNLIIENPPQGASQVLQEAATRLEGKPYNSVGFWLPQDQIRQGLQSNGYLAASVHLNPGTPQKQGDRYLVPLTAVITSGPQYRISSLAIDGGPLLQGRDLSPYVPVHKGDIATPGAFGRLEGALRSTYWKAGYADVAFDDRQELNESDSTAKLSLVVNPGIQYHLNKLSIKDLNPAQENEVRGLLGLKTGDIYDGIAINNLYRQIKTVPDLREKDFTFTPLKDQSKGTVDLTLSFFKRD